MILIDLLPEEYRQKQRTPFKFMVATVASVAINTSLVAWWCWTAFGVAAEVKSELSVLQDTFQGLEGQVKYHHDLEKESAVFNAREEMLATVTNSRVSWTRKTDELVDIVNIGGDGEKYLVWFDSLNVDQRENKRNNEYGRLEAKGFSGSDNFAHVANFLEDVEESNFIYDFMKPGRPEGSQSNYDEELVPSAVWSFPLELGLKAPEERRREQP